MPNNIPNLLTHRYKPTYKNCCWGGIVKIKAVGHHHYRYCFSVFGEEALIGITQLATFRLFITNIYIESVLLPQTNKGIKGGTLSFGDFPWLVGLWLLITSHSYYNIRGFLERLVGIFKGSQIQLHVFININQL